MDYKKQSRLTERKIRRKLLWKWLCNWKQTGTEYFLFEFINVEWDNRFQLYKQVDSKYVHISSDRIQVQGLDNN